MVVKQDYDKLFIPIDQNKFPFFLATMKLITLQDYEAFYYDIINLLHHPSPHFLAWLCVGGRK